MRTIEILIVIIVASAPALAVGVGSGVGIIMETERFAPMVWMCDDRIVYDDSIQPGRVTTEVLVERVQNYAFEGEQIHWLVLVMDKNGIEKITDVHATIGPRQGTGNRIKAGCKRTAGSTILSSCDARILQQKLTAFDIKTMGYYDCLFTVTRPESMQGEYWITVEAEDNTGLRAIMKESEYWFLNPQIALTIDGTINFGVVRPGAVSYSDTLLVGNDCEIGSGVLMDMFISGTDFYDSFASSARCPYTNQLSLNNIRYFATSGAYSTKKADPAKACVDSEGYSKINHGTKLSQAKEIIGCRNYNVGTTYQQGNVLNPGSRMSVTFKLELPIPCSGDFSNGNIYIWGEAV